MEAKHRFYERLATALALGATAAWAALQLAVKEGWKVSAPVWDAVGVSALVVLALCASALPVVLIAGLLDWWRHRETRADIEVERSDRSARVVVRNRGPMGSFTALATLVSVEGSGSGEEDFPRTYHLAWDPLCSAERTITSGGKGVIQLMRAQPAGLADEILLRNLAMLVLGSEQHERAVDLWTSIVAEEHASIVLEIEVVRAGTTRAATKSFRFEVSKRGFSVVNA